MDEIFKEIDDVAKALDRAKSMGIDLADEAKAIVLSCIEELKKVAGELDVIGAPEEEVKMSLKDRLTSF